MGSIALFIPILALSIPIIAIVSTNWRKVQERKVQGGPRIEALERRIEQLESALGTAAIDIKELEDKQNYFTRLLEDK